MSVIYRNASHIGVLFWVLATVWNSTVTDAQTSATPTFEVSFDVIAKVGPGTPTPSGTLMLRGQTMRALDTALKEHLGLKLQSTRGPVDLLIVDSVDRPTDN